MKLGQTVVKRPAFMWTALAVVLVVVAVMVPPAWIDSVNHLVGTSGGTDRVFSTPVARVDNALAAGQDPAVDADTLADMRPILQVRRVAKTGPMNQADVEQATTLLRRYDRELGRQSRAGVRQTLRRERAQQLGEALPRLDPTDIDDALDELGAQLRRAGLDRR